MAPEVGQEGIRFWASPENHGILPKDFSQDGSMDELLDNTTFQYNFVRYTLLPPLVYRGGGYDLLTAFQYSSMKFSFSLNSISFIKPRLMNFV